MHKTLNYYNGFGIEPKNNYVSAGTDYFIPIIDSTDTEMVKRVEDAFFVDPENADKAHSFNVTKNEAEEIKTMMWEVLSNKFDDAKTETLMGKHWHNILHLYLSLQSYSLECLRIESGKAADKYCIADITYFVDNYLRFDKNGIPGLCVEKDDYLFINSGIKVALDADNCGLYVNKSGTGNKGWDVRACLVDEDYAGYVHLSCTYTKNTHIEKLRTVYCGDKITQMMVFEIHHCNMQPISADEYAARMANSERGEKKTGSSDVKH